MQDPARAGSTLELVVNEQNMSQISLNCSTNDLSSRPPAFDSRLNQTQDNPTDSSRFCALRSWPTKFKNDFKSKLDDAKLRSETRAQYIIEVARLFSGIIIWLACFTCTIIIPAILLVIGLANLDDCSARPALPYLVFGIGFVMTASNLFNLAFALDFPVFTNHKLLSTDIKNTIASILNILFNCVVFFLYILCAFMTFKAPAGSGMPSPDGSSDVKLDELKCNSLLFGLTFWFIALTLGSFVIICLLASLLYAYNRYRMAIIRGSAPRSQQTVDATVTATETNYNNNSQCNPTSYETGNRM